MCDQIGYLYAADDLEIGLLIQFHAALLCLTKANKGRCDWYAGLDFWNWKIWFDVEVVVGAGVPLTIRSSLGPAAQRESKQPAAESS